MIYDCHLHTDFSGDSGTPAKAQIERAAHLGMKEICITDHHDYGCTFDNIDFNLDIPAYLHSLNQLKTLYKDQICINIGIELGLQKHLKDYLDSFTETYGDSFDFIIGSSHYVDGKDPYFPDFWEGADEADCLERFFKVSLERILLLSHTFDSYGHLDYIVRYCPNDHTLYSYERFHFLIDAILQALIDNGKALECNTGGFRYGLREPNPHSSILKRYRELGGELLTIGSDAHKADDLGSHFDQCRQLLLSCGFRYYTVYHRRKPEMLPL